MAISNVVLERRKMDKWDEKLVIKIIEVGRKYFWNGEEILKVISQDRKHQREELLNRLPSVEEIKKELSADSKSINELAQTILVTAIHDFIKEKLVKVVNTKGFMCGED